VLILYVVCIGYCTQFEVEFVNKQKNMVLNIESTIRELPAIPECILICSDCAASVFTSSMFL
jgi:hypothetical protein